MRRESNHRPTPCFLQSWEKETSEVSPIVETRWHIQLHGITKYSTKIDHKTRKINKEHKTKGSETNKGFYEPKKQRMSRRGFLVSIMIRNEKYNNIASKKPNG